MITTFIPQEIHYVPKICASLFFSCLMVDIHIFYISIDDSIKKNLMLSYHAS